MVSGISFHSSFLQFKTRRSFQKPSENIHQLGEMLACDGSGFVDVLCGDWYIGDACSVVMGFECEDAAGAASGEGELLGKCSAESAVAGAAVGGVYLEVGKCVDESFGGSRYV